MLGIHRRVLHSEGLCAAHDDTVGNNQTDEYRQGLADVANATALSTWSTMITSEAMITICTIIRMLFGNVVANQRDEQVWRTHTTVVRAIHITTVTLQSTR